MLPMIEKVTLTGVRFGWTNRKCKSQAYTRWEQVLSQVKGAKTGQSGATESVLWEPRLCVPAPCMLALDLHTPGHVPKMLRKP